jgi:hypothetical protein
MAYKNKSHGGSPNNYLTTVSLYNYFLLNYFPAKLEFPEKKQKFIHMNKFSFITIFNIMALNYINNIDYLNDKIRYIMKEFEYFETLIEHSIGIILHIVPTYLLDKLMASEMPPPTMTHAVAFMKCGGKEYFYDNNGVSPIAYYDFELRPEDITLNKEEIYSNEDDELEKFKSVYRETQKRLMVPFNWKQYILKKIETAKRKLQNIIESNDLTRKNEFKDIILDFSECFYGHNPGKTIGNNMYKSMFLEGLDIILEKDLQNEEIYDLFTYSTLYHNNIYDNDEAIEKLVKNSKNPTNLIIMAISANNKKLLDYLITKLNVPPAIIAQIKDSMESGKPMGI